MKNYIRLNNNLYNFSLNSNLTSFKDKFAYIGGWVSPDKVSQGFSYPTGWTKNNTVISGIRCKTPYGTFVDNTYSASYAVGIVLGETITVYKQDTNPNYTEFTVHLFKWSD